MKEIIYTAIFIGLGILLITLFLIMFHPKKVYTASLVLGSQNVNVEVAVDADHINSISFSPLSDSVATMYPLMAPSITQLSDQICQTQSLENLSYPEGSQYTSQALVGAIRTALGKATAN